jgi:hypothetical protein
MSAATEPILKRIQEAQENQHRVLDLSGEGLDHILSPSDLFDSDQVCFG